MNCIVSPFPVQLTIGECVNICLAETKVFANINDVYVSLIE